LPDVERILTRIYTYSVKTKVKAFYIDALAVTRLDEFYDLMMTLRELITMLKDIFHDKSSSQPSSLRLRQLVNFKRVTRVEEDEEMKEESDDDGIYPDYLPILDEFDNMIVWKT